MNYAEMARIASDPAAVRGSAKFVKTVLAETLSEREREFLAGLEKFDGADPLSIRQREWLFGLRARTSRRAMVKGYRASTLVEKLWELRFDLAEEAEEFVTDLHEQLKAAKTEFTLSDPQWRYVFALCHQVGEIERYVSL